MIDFDALCFDLEDAEEAARRAGKDRVAVWLRSALRNVEQAEQEAQAARGAS
jgi:hypothetical protein